MVGTAPSHFPIVETSPARKIRDAYAFITQNWAEGDEIFLFGFSRGAYTARKVAGLIVCIVTHKYPALSLTRLQDRIGVLDVKDMGNF